MNMKNKKQFPWERFRFEFVLYINEQTKRDEKAKKPIICQRYFDVRDYNKDVLNSMEIKTLIDSLTGVHTPTMGLIPKFLKQISKRHSWSNYNPYRVVAIEEETKDLFENEDVFTFEIKVDKRVVAKSSFSANWFQKDVRYGVNIKEIIPEIIKEIEFYFSRDEYTIPFAALDEKN